MKAKTRDISKFDYFQALQKEHVSCEIRSKIYVTKNDREYFKKLMGKKRDAIQTLAAKNRLDSIFTSKDEALKVWAQIVPEFGFPDLVYNVFNVSSRELQFPYKGTVVSTPEGYGIVDRVEDIRVGVIFYGRLNTFALEQVERCGHRQTDEFYYYFPGNQFRVKDEKVIGILNSVNFENKIAKICFDGMLSVDLPLDQISRIL